MANKYYFFFLEIALRKSDDPNIYAYENISHIPTRKLIELFEIDLNKDPYIIDGYFLKKISYKKNKIYINQNIGKLNLDVFEYCLRQYSTDDFKEIRKLFKEDLME